MICYVHRDSRFERRLRELRKSSGTALSAAKKAEEIINRLLVKGRENSLKVGKLTRKGELRIKSGVKFDLGNGYRLVCAKKGPHLILLYVGTHDDCSRWLERNKGLKYDIDENGGDMAVTRRSDPPYFQSAMPGDPAEEYEEQLMKQIDDKVIRNIFCGLVDK
jgi:hypothetical protein